MAEAGADRTAVKLANPISEEHGYLRTSVLPGLIEVAKRNHSRGFRDLALQLEKRPIGTRDTAPRPSMASAGAGS